VTMKNAIFLGVTSCSYCKNRRFGGMHRLHHQGDKNMLATTLAVGLRLIVTANVVPSSHILVTLMMEVITFLRNVGFYRGTRCHVTDNTILHTFGICLWVNYEGSDTVYRV
jgi:hypothetical protein